MNATEQKTAASQMGKRNSGTSSQIMIYPFS